MNTLKMCTIQRRTIHYLHVLAENVWDQSCNIPLPGRTPCCLHLNPDQQQPSTAHHRRQIHTYSLELLMMGIEMPETCWANHKSNKVHTVTSSWFFFFSTHMQRCTDRHTSRSSRDLNFSNQEYRKLIHHERLFSLPKCPKRILCSPSILFKWCRPLFMGKNRPGFESYDTSI